MAEREPYPSEKQDRFIIRLPEGMRDRIKAAAEANNRSMNAEIVATLEEKYPAPTGPDIESMTMTEWLNYIDGAQNPSDVKARVDEVNRRLRNSANLHIFEVRYTEVSPLGFPEELYIARSRTHPDVQARSHNRYAPISQEPKPPTDD